MPQGFGHVHEAPLNRSIHRPKGTKAAMRRPNDRFGDGVGKAAELATLALLETSVGVLTDLLKTIADQRKRGGIARRPGHMPPGA